MANVGEISQSITELAVLAPASLQTASISQSVIELLVGLGIACGNPPAGRIGSPYSHFFPAGAGDPPYTFSILNPPTSLTINAATGELSGVPSQTGTYTPTVTVADSLGASASVQCSITIGGAVIPPIGGGGGFRGIRPSSCGCSPEILAAEKLRRLSLRKRLFPYPFVFPAPATIPVDLVADAAVPAPGLTVTVVSYTVPEGFRLILQAVLQDYAGGGAAFTAGDALWTVDINNGAVNVQAMPIQGLTNVPVPLGSIAAGLTWPFARAYNFAPLTLIQGKATNVNLAGGFFHSGLFGYLVPDVPK